MCVHDCSRPATSIYDSHGVLIPRGGQEELAQNGEGVESRTESPSLRSFGGRTGGARVFWSVAALWAAAHSPCDARQYSQTSGEEEKRGGLGNTNIRIPSKSRFIRTGFQEYRVRSYQVVECRRASSVPIRYSEELPIESQLQTGAAASQFRPEPDIFASLVSGFPKG